MARIDIVCEGKIQWERFNIDTVIRSSEIDKDLKIKIKASDRKIDIVAKTTKHRTYHLTKKKGEQKVISSKYMSEHSRTYKELKSICEVIKDVWKQAIRR